MGLKRHTESDNDKKTKKKKKKKKKKTNNCRNDWSQSKKGSTLIKKNPSLEQFFLIEQFPFQEIFCVQ